MSDELLRGIIDKYDLNIGGQQALRELLAKVKQHYEQKIKKENMLRIASLTLLVAEIQGCKDIDGVGRILKPWIDANDLEPEKVETFNSIEELLKYYEQTEEAG